MRKKSRLILTAFFFAFSIYCSIAFKKLFPYSVFLFVIPFLLLDSTNAEVGFIMSFVFLILSLSLTKINNYSLIESFIISLSIIVFYIVKTSAEKNLLTRKSNVILESEKIRKDISVIESNIKFYETYISKKEKTIEMRKRIISFLRDIEASSSEEDVMSAVTKSIKMLYPESEPVFIVSPYTSPIIEDVFRTKTPAFIPDTSKDFRYSSSFWSERDRSVMLVPFSVSSKILAVLKISAPVEGYFTRDDFITAEIISATASTTIENISLYKTIDNLARKDGLTGVFTRRIFDEKIDEEILVSARTRQPFCLFIIDIDHFKKINDTYGHQTGDEVLKRVALTITSNAREFDFVARYGGEEFAVIMPATGKEDAVKVAHNIAMAVKKLSFSSDKKVFGITISGGVGEFPSEAQSKNQIIRICDERLYSAKKSGRDRIVYE